MFISRQRVYWDNLDLLGVLHNAHYILLFERARFDFWRHNGVGPNAPGFDWPYVVAKNEVNYRQAITSEQDVAVMVAVQRMGASSVTFAHAVYMEDGTLSADGYTVLVRLDAETNRPIPWSKAFREMVKPYLLPGA
ncbi:MAG TPA: thioesterase family protein [Chthonomonadaceae bacterium]|nr:thioesterase family protein [Chthonomonadaceae bacterium]